MERTSFDAVSRFRLVIERLDPRPADATRPSLASVAPGPARTDPAPAVTLSLTQTSGSAPAKGALQKSDVAPGPQLPDFIKEGKKARTTEAIKQLQRLVKQARMLMMMAGADPRAQAHLAAQIARQIKAAAKEYKESALDEHDHAAGLSPSVELPAEVADAINQAGSSSDAPSSTSSSTAAPETAEASPDSATGAAPAAAEPTPPSGVSATAAGPRQPIAANATAPPASRADVQEPGKGPGRGARAGAAEHAGAGAMDVPTAPTGVKPSGAAVAAAPATPVLSPRERAAEEGNRLFRQLGDPGGEARERLILKERTFFSLVTMTLQGLQLLVERGIDAEHQDRRPGVAEARKRSARDALDQIAEANGALHEAIETIGQHGEGEVGGFDGNGLEPSESDAAASVQA